jgi:hypothetical protein
MYLWTLGLLQCVKIHVIYRLGYRSYVVYYRNICTCVPPIRALCASWLGSVWTQYRSVSLVFDLENSFQYFLSPFNIQTSDMNERTGLDIMLHNFI